GRARSGWIRRYAGVAGGFLVAAALTLSALSESTCSFVTLLAPESALSTASAHCGSNNATTPELLSGSVPSTSALISAFWACDTSPPTPAPTPAPTAALASKAG